jgi:acyl-CoA synthetase (AMP-forming)/AMP-acid ligase II
MATSGTAPQADSTTRLVEIVDSLPVTATGKILKRELAP